MPVLGLGVYRIQDWAICEQTVYDAIEAGYRLIDTATLYHNEEAVGRAIKRGDVPREETIRHHKIMAIGRRVRECEKCF
jgi:diketogulonate reductase-like aldo/keto reductase